MKINSIDIASFGKFCNFHLDFSDGMTLVFGENENGKTTIMAFIRMMFYGNTGKSSDLDKNPRIKYRPWNSDFMAGSITFTHDGSNYRLEREFKRSNSTDKISLIDLDTGEKTTLSGSDDIGANFFGITDSAFERSVFVGELGAPAKNDSADGEINSKLSNLAATGDQDVSFEKINARLLKAKETLMSKSGKKGKYDKAILELEELERKIAESLEKEEQLELLSRQANSKEQVVNECVKESARLFELLKNADKIRKIKRLEKYIEISLAEKENNNSLALKDGGYADKIFLSEIRAKNESLEKTKDKILNLESEIENDLAKINELTNLIETQNNKDDKKDGKEEKLIEINLKIEDNKRQTALLNEEKEGLAPIRKPRFFLVISGIILLVVSAISFVLQITTAGILFSAIGVILTVLGFVIKKSVMPDSADLNKQILEFSSKLSLLLEEKQTVLNEIKTIEDTESGAREKLVANTALLENKKAEHMAKNAELEAHKKFFKEQKLELFEFCSALKPVSSLDEVDSLVALLCVLLERKEQLAHNLNLLGDGTNCASLDEAKEKLNSFSSAESESFSEEELDLVKEKFKAQSDKLAAEKAELAKLNASIKNLAESTESTAVLCRKRDLLKEKIDGYKKYCDTCDLALDTLTNAFRELRRNYSGILDTRVAQIFSRLTGEKYNSVNVSKNFEIGVTTTDAFGLKESGYLSSGTVDQVYLALRLATAELITEAGGSLPIFMDDSLTQYDDRRAKLALEFLKEYSADRQVLLFTCHSYFKDVAETLSIKTLKL